VEEVTSYYDSQVPDISTVRPTCTENDFRCLKEIWLYVVVIWTWTAHSQSEVSKLGLSWSRPQISEQSSGMNDPILSLSRFSSFALLLLNQVEYELWILKSKEDVLGFKSISLDMLNSSFIIALTCVDELGTAVWTVKTLQDQSHEWFQEIQRYAFVNKPSSQCMK